MFGRKSEQSSAYQNSQRGLQSFCKAIWAERMSFGPHMSGSVGRVVPDAWSCVIQGKSRAEPIPVRRREM